MGVTRHGEYICSPQASTHIRSLAKGELGASWRREILGASAFLTFSPKILIFKLSKSNLIKPTSQVISINIRALKTI